MDIIFLLNAAPKTEYRITTDVLSVLGICIKTAQQIRGKKVLKKFEYL